MLPLALWATASCRPVTAADWWVDANATAEGDGSREKPFARIQAAAEVAMPGDTIHVLPGVYRERVMPPRGGLPGKPIVYRSEVRHGAIVKGSDVWTPTWRKEHAGLFSAEVDPAMFTDTGYVDGGNPYRITYDWDQERNNRPPYPFTKVAWTLGQVFVDGRPLRETSSLDELTETPASWRYDPETNRIWINLGGDVPSAHHVELTTRRGVFRPLAKGLGYIEVRGFVFEHCANQFPAQFWQKASNAQSGMVGTRGGHHWVIADNIIRYAKSVGLTFGVSGGRSGAVYDNERPAQAEPDREQSGFHRIEGNIIYANGAVGAMGCGHRDVIIRRNLFLDNNRLQNTAYETGGIKTHQAFGLRIEENWFVDNRCMGVWLDNTWRNCRVSRNVFVNNRGRGLFLEMDDNTPETACLVDCNVFLNGPPRFNPGGKPDESQTIPTRPWSVGVYGHDADGVRCVRNLIAGDGYGFYFRKITNRKGGAAYIEATGNLLIGDDMTAVCLPADRPPTVHDNRFEANVYPGTSADARFVVTAWCSDTGRKLPELLQRIEATIRGWGDDPVPFANPEQAPDGYRLTLEQWRRLTGFDARSVAVRSRCVLDRNTWTLTLTLPAEAARVSVTRDPRVTIDLLGTPFTGDEPPGPFAGWKGETAVFSLPKPPLEAAANSPHAR